jgi:hypothetical protein
MYAPPKCEEEINNTCLSYVYDKNDPEISLERMMAWDKVKNAQVDVRLYYANTR